MATSVPQRRFMAGQRYLAVIIAVIAVSAILAIAGQADGCVAEEGHFFLVSWSRG